METRGRKSVAELAVVPVVPGRRPDPPADLTESEARYWRDAVATKPAEWWKADTQILLTAYCRASAQHDVISSVINSIKPRTLKTEKGWAKYERMKKLQSSTSSELAQLATKMRLTPQSRYTAQSAATADAKASRARPWDAQRSG